MAADLHPRLTVIGGLDPATREALAGEVIDALGGARPGVHLELESAGRSLAVFRPLGGQHRVVDTDSVADVTAQFIGPDGEIDLFASLGVDRALARRTMRLTSEDLVLRSESDARVARLAEADQEELWDSAMRYRSAEILLEQVSDSSGTSTEDAAVVERVEQSHAALVAATERYERIRLIALTIGAVGLLGGAGMIATDRTTAGAPFVLLALMGAILAFFYRRRVAAAARAERDVLVQSGADDYASFHAERVSALLDNDIERRRFMLAVSDHRRAAEHWGRVAGDIPLRFALEHEDDIRTAASLHRDLGGTDSTSSDDVSAELVRAVLKRIHAVRALTADENDLPLVVDDPFGDLDPAVKPTLLELLSGQAGNPQLIVLTADPDVTSWAQVESMTGRLSVIEPTIEPTVAPHRVETN